MRYIQDENDMYFIGFIQEENKIHINWSDDKTFAYEFACKIDADRFKAHFQSWFNQTVYVIF